MPTAPIAHQAFVATWLALAAGCGSAVAQSASNPPEPNRSAKGRPVSYGVEIAFSSGHADRGILISDRPVFQPVTWVSGSVAEFSVWSSFPLTENTDGSRPAIVELELTREHAWRRITIGPAIRMFFYHDLLSRYDTRSIEGWLYLSYDAGPFRVFSNHSLDVLTYRGAYYGDAGIESEGRISSGLEVGGSVGAGWASSRFNAAYTGIAKSAFNRVSAEGWLTAHLTPRFYISPHVEYSSIVDRGVRAGADLIRPTYVLVRLTVGGEF